VTCRVLKSTDRSITINPVTAPVTNFSYTTPVCSGSPDQSPLLNAGFSTGGTFSAPTGLSINATTGVINIASSFVGGPYTITYTVTASGCIAAGSGTSDITINSTNSPVTGFSYISPICNNNDNPIPDTLAGFTLGGVFSSAFGLTINSSTGQIDLLSSTPGNYSVRYTVAANACSAGKFTDTPIIINAAPNPPSASSVTRCGPGNVSLTATGTGTLNWYDNLDLNNVIFQGSALDILLEESTTFYVTDSNTNCKSNPAVIVATINELPEKPKLGRDTAICTGENIVLNAGIYDDYLWQDNSISSIYSVTTTGEYSVTVTNAGNSCTNADTVAINILSDCDDIYFPSAFSPNGDGYNDEFGPGGNLMLIKNYLLSVYDRFGVLIFSTNNPYKKWNGTYYNKERSNSAFIWHASYIFRGANKKQQGNLVLLK
jgi:gliding motility-associated-like protein